MNTEIQIILKGATISDIVNQARTLVMSVDNAQRALVDDVVALTEAGMTIEDEVPAKAPKRKAKAAKVEVKETEDDEDQMTLDLDTVPPYSKETQKTPKKMSDAVAKADAVHKDIYGDEDEDEEIEAAVKAKAKKATSEDVNAAAMAHAKINGRAKTLAILTKKFKVKSVLELKPDQYDSVISALEV
jgi:hypothetical protein